MNTFRHLAAASFTLLTGAAVGTAHAQNFPTRPITIVVPFAPGGVTDLAARQLAGHMQAASPQPVVVENRPGASGLVAAEYTHKSGSDGHLVFFGTPTSLFQAISNTSASVDPVKVLVPVIHLFDVAAIIVTRPGLPAGNLGELIALSKKSGGKLTFGTSGTTSDKAPYPIELLKSMTGLTFTMVNYKGESPAILDVVAERTDFAYGSTTTTVAQIKAGKLKAIAAVAPSRIPDLPGTPTLAESVPGYNASIFIGLFSSVDAPRAAIVKVNELAAGALKIPAFREDLQTKSLYPVGGTQEAFAARVRADEASYAKLMR